MELVLELRPHGGLEARDSRGVLLGLGSGRLLALGLGLLACRVSRSRVVRRVKIVGPCSSCAIAAATKCYWHMLCNGYGIVVTESSRLTMCARMLFRG